MLVIDANVAVAACSSSGGFDRFGKRDLVAPGLMWSEALSTLHLLKWRSELTTEEAEDARTSLESCPVERREPRELGDETWRVADELGWAKTYDAEYVALARLLECKLVTLDGRLRRGADRLGLVIAPLEL